MFPKNNPVFDKPDAGGGAPPPADGGGDPGIGIGTTPAGKAVHGIATLTPEPPADDKGATSAPKPPTAPPAATPPAAPPAPKTAADGGTPPPDDKGDAPPPAATWPENWRALYNPTGDRRLAERLSRMASPNDIFNSWRSLEQQLSSGQYKKNLPTHYTEAELAEYRRSNGIPDKPEDYDDNLGNGIVWGENDKPHIENFKQYAFDNNMTPNEVKNALGWWAQYQNQLVSDMQDTDQTNLQAALSELRSMWSGKVQGNLNFVRGKFDAEAGLWDTVMNARGADGKLLGDNPKFLKFMHDQLATGDPYGAALPGNGQPGKSVDDEIAEIRPLMADKRSKYWRGPEAAGMQDRYRQLIEIKQRASAAGQ